MTEHSIMCTSFTTDLYDGHLIFSVDGLKVLVDTGSPVTIGRQDVFLFMGKEYGCMTSFIGNDINDISSMMGYDIDVLMGMDVLADFCILTDYRQGLVTFSSKPIPFEHDSSTPILRGQRGAVCILLNVKGKTVKMALDTGAKISYIDDSLTAGETALEIRDDFNPMTGHFATPIFAMEAEIGGKTFPVNFGNLPPLLSLSLKMMNLDGAIGYDLFTAFTTMMDFHDNLLKIR